MLTAKEAARATASKMHDRLMPRIDVLVWEAINEGKRQVTVEMIETYDEQEYIRQCLLALGYEVLVSGNHVVEFEISWYVTTS